MVAFSLIISIGFLEAQHADTSQSRAYTLYLHCNSSQALLKYILNLSHFRLTNRENNVKKAQSWLHWSQREKGKTKKR